MFNLPKDEITFEVVENFCREWPEGVRVEYKQEIKDIPKIVSSFANTQGGIYIIGVKANQTDNKVVFPIEGIPETAGIEERIIQSAYQGIYPPVMPEVIKVNVPESDNVEELTMQLLWAFNIPTDNENIIGHVRKAIEYHVSE
jgi:predicted HTH transcriptional regulator